MSVMLAQINLAFDEKYGVKAINPHSQDTSHMHLSKYLLAAAKSHIPTLAVEELLVFHTFQEKVKLMGQVLITFSSNTGQDFKLKSPWKRVFKMLIEESLPYSRDGSCDLISCSVRI